MKAIATMAAAAALLGLAACNQLAPSSGASNDKAKGAPADKARATGRTAGVAGTTPGNTTLASGEQRGLAGNPNVIPASSNLAVPAVDRAFLIGRWTDSRDCEEAGEFAADGRYTNAAGVGAGWTLEGDRLTMAFAGAAPRMLRVSALDQNTLNVVNPDGSIGRSTRC